MPRRRPRAWARASERRSYTTRRLCAHHLLPRAPTRSHAPHPSRSQRQARLPVAVDHGLRPDDSTRLRRTAGAVRDDAAEHRADRWQRGALGRGRAAR
eukprot:2464158-Prymnesium_polylepis.1